MKRAFDTIAKQSIKINELEALIAYKDLVHEQQLEIYKAWNKQDQRRIKELIEENKQLKQKQNI